jgi:hypothetical protein
MTGWPGTATREHGMAPIVQGHERRLEGREGGKEFFVAFVSLWFAEAF